jgi:hypothetical protein
VLTRSSDASAGRLLGTAAVCRSHSSVKAKLSSCSSPELRAAVSIRWRTRSSDSKVTPQVRAGPTTASRPRRGHGPEEVQGALTSSPGRATRRHGEESPRTDSNTALDRRSEFTQDAGEAGRLARVAQGLAPPGCPRTGGRPGARGPGFPRVLRVAGQLRQQPSGTDTPGANAAASARADAAPGVRVTMASARSPSAPAPRAGGCRPWRTICRRPIGISNTRRWRPGDPGRPGCRRLARRRTQVPTRAAPAPVPGWWRRMHLRLQPLQRRATRSAGRTVTFRSDGYGAR